MLYKPLKSDILHNTNMKYKNNKWNKKERDDGKWGQLQGGCCLALCWRRHGTIFDPDGYRISWLWQGCSQVFFVRLYSIRLPGLYCFWAEACYRFFCLGCCFIFGCLGQGILSCSAWWEAFWARWIYWSVCLWQWYLERSGPSGFCGSDIYGQSGSGILCSIRRCTQKSGTGRAIWMV